MPKKSTVPSGEIDGILDKIKHAEQVRKDADERYGYSRALQLYNGEFKSVSPSWMANIELIPINEVYAYVKTFIPSVYSRDPFIAVNPKGSQHILGAKILELAVNAYWRELRLKKEVRRCLFDAVFAEGWMKTGYSADIGKEKADDPAIEPSEFIRNEEIFAARIPWKQMVRDPDAVDGIHDARWVAQQIVRPFDAVLRSSLYENKKDLAPNFMVDYAGLTPSLRAQQSMAMEYLSFWEVWDRDDRRVYTVAEGHHTFLRNIGWPYKSDSFPYDLLRFNDNADEPYAINLIAPWEPQLWEKMKIRAMELDHLKRFGRQLKAEKGALTRQEMDKYTKGITGSIIQYEQGRQGPEPIPYPPIQSDMYAVENRIDLDKDNISGQPNAVRSAPQRTQSRTLGEIDRLISAFQFRQNDPTSVIEDFSAEVAYKLIGLMQQFFSAKKFVRATKKQLGDLIDAFVDEDGNPRFDGSGFVFSKKDIQDTEFDIEVRAGSTLPLDKQGRIEAMTNILKLGPSIGVTPGDKVSRVIGKNLMTEFDMPEITQAYEEVIAKMDAAETTAQVGEARSLDLVQGRINKMAQRVTSGMSQGGDGGGL
jgi:hypothetical protein